MTTNTAPLAATHPALAPLRVVHHISFRFAGTKEYRRVTYRWIAQDGAIFSTKKAAVAHNLDSVLA